MIQIEKTTTITVDDQVLQVVDLSDEVQQLIQHLDDWRQDEVDQASQLLKTRAALRDLQNVILQQLQADNSEDESSDKEDAVAEDVKVGELVD